MLAVRFRRFRYGAAAENQLDSLCGDAIHSATPRDCSTRCAGQANDCRHDLRSGELPDWVEQGIAGRTRRLGAVPILMLVAFAADAEVPGSAAIPASRGALIACRAASTSCGGRTDAVPVEALYAPASRYTTRRIYRRVGGRHAVLILRCAR